MHDLDLPRGDARELVIDRDRVYELNGELVNAKVGSSATYSAVSGKSFPDDWKDDLLMELARLLAP